MSGQTAAVIKANVTYDRLHAEQSDATDLFKVEKLQREETDTAEYALFYFNNSGYAFLELLNTSAPDTAVERAAESISDYADAMDVELNELTLVPRKNVRDEHIVDPNLGINDLVE